MRNAIQTVLQAVTLIVLAAYIFAVLAQLVVQFVRWLVAQFNVLFANQYLEPNITYPVLVVQLIVAAETMEALMALATLLVFLALLLVTTASLLPLVLLA